jgi:hypothetical protein
MLIIVKSRTSTSYRLFINTNLTSKYLRGVSRAYERNVSSIPSTLPELKIQAYCMENRITISDRLQESINGKRWTHLIASLVETVIGGALRVDGSSEPK